MKWMLSRLEKLTAVRQAYELTWLLIAVILMPGLLVIHASKWFILCYIFAPFILIHRDLRFYYSSVYREIIVVGVLTLVAIALLLFSKSEGIKTFYAALSIIASLVLVQRIFSKLIKHVKLYVEQ